MSVQARWFVLAAAAYVFPARGISGQEAFTLEQVMSSPFPTELVAAPTGGGVAWVQNSEGRRNLWVAEPPASEGRSLTSYDRDDGREISDLRWTPDAGRIVFVRGGAPNRAGDVPNPDQYPDGQTRSVWVVDLQGGEPTEIAEGARPRISPDGARVAFLNGGQVQTATLDGEGEAEQLFHVRRGVGAAEWSPDGSMVAFVSARGDHAFVGVFDTRADEVRYLGPGVDRDGSPVWSPDSRRVAFIRTPNVQDALPFFPRRTGHPWSIHVADARTGSTSEVWSAREGVGSVFRPVSATGQLMWGADDRLVFPWEGDGWTHLYSVPASGGSATPLTPGAFEVQWVALTPDGREVLYSSNEGDVDRQHLWRVGVGGGPATQITGGVGVEWGPVMASDGTTLAYMGSGPTEPALTRVLVGGDVRSPGAAALPEDFPSERLVQPQQVVFSSTDGMPIHGQLFLPSDLRPGERRPAVLFLHGGSRRQMLLAFHHRGYYHNAYAMNQYLASQGFIVLAVNYRSGIGYGMEFREALNYGASGGAEVQDVLAAGLYLKSRDDVDPGRLGLWGGSYGGYLTAMGLAKASDMFRAGVDLHGVHDWNTGIGNFVPSYVPEHHPELSRVAFEASPMAWLDDWRSPVLVIHGDDDRNVNFNETVKLVEQLRARGVETEELVFPDEVHGFLLHRNWLAAYRATAAFFEEKLGGAAAPATF